MPQIGPSGGPERPVRGHVPAQGLESVALAHREGCNDRIEGDARVSRRELVSLAHREGGSRMH